MDPIERRSAFVRSVQRTLQGPLPKDAADDPSAWLGANPSSNRILGPIPDQTEGTYSRGSIRTPDGQEVLYTQPSWLYGVGVLRSRANREDERPDSGLPYTQSEPENGDNASEDEDLPLSSDATGPAENTDGDDMGDPQIESVRQMVQPSSIAVTCHLPNSITSGTIAIGGGGYEQQAQPDGRLLWVRYEVNHIIENLRLDETGTVTVRLHALTLTVGVRIGALSEIGRYATIYLENQSPTGGDEHALFQASLALRTDGLLPYGENANTEAGSFDLLYRNVPILAVGHGCDAKVEQVGEGSFVVTSEMFPVVELDSITPDISDSSGESYAVGMRNLHEMAPEASDALNRIMQDYAQWIDDKETESQYLPARLQPTANRHIEACRDFLHDMRSGWALVQSNKMVQEAFTTASKIIDMQRYAASLPRRKTNEAVEPYDNVSQSYWRPFQIAFLLASIPPTVDLNHPKRNHVDIIWMPTGGGKTEAYLGLTAFTLIWDRLIGTPSEHKGVKVLMRYTLRLLTTQQLQRAASMICALEVVRASNPRLGSDPFRIGALLGRATTPNTREEAVSALRNHKDAKAFLLKQCPWCGHALGKIDGTVAGYEKSKVKKQDGSWQWRVALYCPDPSCFFTKSNLVSAGLPEKAGSPRGIPVYEVDEDIFVTPPSMIIGTLDKFVRVSKDDRYGKLFGLYPSGRRQRPAPRLFIQDELHLVSGPLGTLAALYESVLEILCTQDGGILPRIVCATATTKNYEEQIMNLYSRAHTRLIPPPGLEIADSFFGRTADRSQRRLYVGVYAPGFMTNASAQVRLLATLNQTAGMLSLEASQEEADPWWTNLVFFSSRRALGVAQNACSLTLARHLYSLSQISGVDAGGPREDGTRKPYRAISMRELTAASTSDTSEVLASLALTNRHSNRIDICFATSMIEVGLDVPRLGLMTIMGQPKSFSQYIQVTGRVGRSRNAPATVFVLLSPHNVRDRSHFETFTTTHNRLYAGVEAASLTPYTRPALQRGLAGVILALLLNAHSKPDLNSEMGQIALQQIYDKLTTRAALQIDDRGLHYFNEEWDRLIAARRRMSLEGTYRHAASEANPYESMTLGQEAITTSDHWRTPNSLRTVEGEAGLEVVARNISAPMQPRSSNSETPPIDDEDI